MPRTAPRASAAAGAHGARRTLLGITLAVGLLGALGACRAALPADAGVSTARAADSLAIRRDVAYLASDRLEGRGTGTAGNDSAAAYIGRRLTALGLTVTPQPFQARSVALAHAGQPEGVASQNVVAVLRGTDPALRDEYLVLGAHFDHLGRSPASAQDPEAGDAIRNGADDNASGTAAVLELARLLARRPPKRSVVFALFSGEELGLLGSEYFVEHPVVPLDRVVAMLNFDMVGRMRNDEVIVYGVATADELPDVVQRANAADPRGPLQLTAQGDGFGASDHAAFYARDVPVLHFFTNVHDDYHKATDDVEKIDAAGAARVTALAERVARELADRSGRLTFRRAPAPTSTSTYAGSQVYLGSVPDMGAVDVAGVKLSAVRPGSPADRAGLRAGDVIVEFDGKAVKDLYGYTDALFARQPGDEVTLVVLRDGARLPVKVVLGKRGS